jgi:hypothetical protein
METCDGSSVVVSRATARKKEIGRAGLSRVFWIAELIHRVNVAG